MWSVRKKGTVLLASWVEQLFYRKEMMGYYPRIYSSCSIAAAPRTVAKQRWNGCRWRLSLCRRLFSDSHESVKMSRLDSSVVSQNTKTLGSAIRDSKLAGWRAGLPSMEETHQTLRRGGKTNETDDSCTDRDTNQMNTLEKNDDALDWRECVKISRALYEKEWKLMSGTFWEFLMDRSLEDTYARRHTYLRVSLTEKCNLRCLYCMPEEGVDLTAREHLLTVDEIERLVRLFALAGVKKVRLTGGEPTLRRDLHDIVKRISRVDGINDVGITSNGLMLSRSLGELKDHGVSLINLSLDTLKPERFEQMTRRRGHDRVMKTLDTALKVGFDPVKVNIVVMKGVNDDEMLDFVKLTENRNINVRFIEYMPFDGNVWSTEKLVTFEDMKRILTDALPLERCTDGYGEVAKNYKVPGYKGTVSFVTSMTKAFCSECTRIRLMADGNFKVCLFGANEVSLRDAIRQGATDEDLLAVISAAVDRKKAAHAGIDVLHTLKNRPMVKIGG